MKRAVLFHRTCAVLWALVLYPALRWWPDSVAFVIVASVYANVKSDWGAAEAADDTRVLQRLDRIEAMLTDLTEEQGVQFSRESALGAQLERRDEYPDPLAFGYQSGPRTTAQLTPPPASVTRLRSAPDAERQVPHHDDAHHHSQQH